MWQMVTVNQRMRVGRSLIWEMHSTGLVHEVLFEIKITICHELFCDIRLFTLQQRDLYCVDNFLPRQDRRSKSSKLLRSIQGQRK